MHNTLLPTVGVCRTADLHTLFFVRNTPEASAQNTGHCCPDILPSAPEHVLSHRQACLSLEVTIPFLYRTWKRGTGRTLPPVSGWHSTRLPRAKLCEATWLCQLWLYRQNRPLFLLDGNKLQILSLRAFSQLLFQLSLLQPSSLSNCICQHCRRTVQPVGRLRKLEFAMWILMFSKAPSCHSEWHFILFIVISFLQ